MSEPLLELRGVTRRFGGTVAVDGLSFALRSGAVTGLIGPNGAGKTTVVNLIAGRLRPDAGELRWRGRTLPNGPHRVARAGVGRLFQDVRVFGSMSVLENVEAAVPGQSGEGVLAALLAPRRVAAEARAVRARALEELEFVGLADRAESIAGSLSYGQQKLVAIARLLAAEAELLLLDEPASGVHPRRVAELAVLIPRLVAAGRTVLLVEHNMALVRQTCQELILLDRGRCRAAGATEQVWSSAAFAEVYELAGR